MKERYGDGVNVDEYACGVVPVRLFDQERGHRRYYVRRDGEPARELGMWAQMTQFNPETRRALVVAPIVERHSTGDLRYTTDPDLKRKMNTGIEWNATLIDEWALRFLDRKMLCTKFSTSIRGLNRNYRASFSSSVFLGVQ